MRILLSAIVLTVVGLASAASAAEPRRKLNVLMIVVDDLNNDLGCYGHALVKSPNIDRLASRRVRFERAYCQYAVCAPSRWSFLSGLRPETTGIYDFKTLLRSRIPDVVFLPQLFRQNGYFTAGNGKVFHDMRQSDAAISWDFYDDKMGGDPHEAAAVKRRYSFPEGKRPFEWFTVENAGDKTRDGITARKIAGFIEDQHKEGKPFFVAAGFHKPHLPWTAPAKHFDFYDHKRIVVNDPPLKNIPAIALMTELTGNPPPKTRAEAIAAYFACISFTDAQIGILLDTLDRLDLWDDTIVVFFSDHGYHLGDHDGLWAKWTIFEHAARVPLIIAAPGHGRGTTTTRIVELIDIYPTLADLYQLKQPARLDGRSLAPLLKKSDAAWDRPAYILVHHNDVEGKSVRTNRWRYNEWDQCKQGAELYDHESDPGEYNNLVRDARYAGTVADLKRLLTKN